MPSSKKRRRRGVVLSPQGWKRLQAAQKQSEVNHNSKVPYTIEDLRELTQLSPNTLTKVKACKTPVDRHTLEKYFHTFGLELTDEDCLSSISAPNQPEPQFPEQPYVTTLIGQQDWGEAIDVSIFHGRTEELSILSQWVSTDHCRLISILGMGGIGKTALAVKLAQQMQHEFDFIIWRSLRNAPPLETLLTDLVSFLSQQQQIDPDIKTLLQNLQAYRCLVVLDNMETILQPGQLTGYYRPGYENYGDLLTILGESNHQSCVLLTSREKPATISMFEGVELPVRSLSIDGSLETAMALIDMQQLVGTAEQKQTLCEHYSSSPLALKITGSSIQDLFEGNIALFLAEDIIVFNGIRRLLDKQFDRLSRLEHSIMNWLAVNREWTSMSELIADIVPKTTRSQLLEALESLKWRSLIESRSGQYTQQPVIMEYVTDRIVQSVIQELEYLGVETHQDNPHLTSPLLFRTHALLKATAKDYIRESQQRMILSGIVEKIRSTFSHPQAISQYMQAILRGLRQNEAPSYSIGNFINLCRQLDLDLHGYDFAGLAVRQAYLSELPLHQVNFTHTHFQDCQFNYSFSGVCSLALNPENTLLAMGDLHSNIYIWRTSDYQYLGILAGHTDGVFCLAFSADGQFLLSGSGDTTLKLWRIKDYRCLRTFEGHKNLVKSVVFAANSQTIASGCSDQTVKVWDANSGQCIKTLEGHTGSVRAITLSSTEQILASGSLDHTIKLWDWQSGECLKTLEGHTQGLWAVAFAPDGQRLISGSMDQTIRVWDVQSGDCVQILSGHQSSVLAVILSPDGQKMASGSQEGMIKIWHLPSGKCEKSFLGHIDRAWALAFANNGQRLYSGSYQDSRIRIWDTRQGQCVKTLSGYTNAVWSLAFTDGCRTLASGSHDTTIRLWDVEQEQCIQTYQHNTPVLDLSFSPDGGRLASSSGLMGVDCSLWDLHTMELLESFSGHTRIVNAVDIHPDGTFLASASEDQTLKFWDLTTGSCLRTIKAHDELIWSVTFAHNGNLVATGSYDNTVKIWEFNTGNCISILQGHTDQILAVDFSSDDKLIASTSSDGSIKIWDIPTGNCQMTLMGHKSFVSSGKFSPVNDTQVISGGFDGLIKIWDIESEQCERTLEGHNQTVWSLAMSVDGQWLASGDESAIIKLWDMHSWNCLKTFKLPGLYEGMNITGVKGLSEAQKLSLIFLGGLTT